jgi:hypothetical protein
MRREFWMNRTSIEEKPSEERDPWLHEDRAEEEEKINGGEKDFGERRRELSGGERVKVSEKMGVWLQGWWNLE